MKKLLYITLLIAACHTNNNDGTYVNHTDGQYSIVDDTITISDTVVINCTGYQKIRNDRTLPKNYKVSQWTLHSPDALLCKSTVTKFKSEAPFTPNCHEKVSSYYIAAVGHKNLCPVPDRYGRH